ncbi:MAG: MBL fold metallo-hydrolase [archaeon]|nr:MBL fold metallo-hydrolase [archaeon]
MSLNIAEVGCLSGGECFLITTEDKAALVDTGFAVGANHVVNNIEKILYGRNLDYVILTHSHYDHVSGIPLIRKNWPNAKILSASHAAEVFRRPGAIKIMEHMNYAAAQMLKKKISFNIDLSCLQTDIVIGNGDVIDLGSTKFEVIEAPGHTWDSLAFWCKSENLMISCETMGVPSGKNSVLPAYLVSYKRAMNFIKLVDKLDPQQMLVAHNGVFNAGETRKYIDEALHWNEYCKSRIMTLHREGLCLSDIKQTIKDELYTDVIKEKQPEIAFDLNNDYLVPMVIKECSTDNYNKLHL